MQKCKITLVWKMERKSQMTFKSSFGSKNTDLVLEQMAQVTENGCLNPGPN